MANVPEPTEPHRRRRLVARLPRLTWRRLLVVAGTVALSFGMEALITAAIAFFALRLGFWWGLAAFTTTWLLAGLVVLAITQRLWFERVGEKGDQVLLAKGVLGRWIVGMARRARFPATLLVAWFLGPLEAPPAFLALGYRGGELALWEIASAPIFCGFWFSWAVGGFELARGLLGRLL